MAPPCIRIHRFFPGLSSLALLTSVSFASASDRE